MAYALRHLGKEVRVVSRDPPPPPMMVFPGVPQWRPEDILAAHGLTPSLQQSLDEEKGVTVVSWRRAAA